MSNIFQQNNKEKLIKNNENDLIKWSKFFLNSFRFSTICATILLFIYIATDIYEDHSLPSLTSLMCYFFVISIISGFSYNKIIFYNRSKKYLIISLWVLSLINVFILIFNLFHNEINIYKNTLNNIGLANIIIFYIIIFFILIQPIKEDRIWK